MQVFGDTLSEAQARLAAIKRQAGGFVSERDRSEAPSPKLPAWSATAAKTSDAYLAQVAATAGLTLATFDRSIPSAIRILACRAAGITKPPRSAKAK
jgi:predicted nucleic acid-binding protein